MKYYIITYSVWESLTKDNVSYRKYNSDRSQVAIATTDTVSNNVSSYDTAAKLAEAVDLIEEFNGLEEWEIYEILYYQEIDD
jgi:hypothetical protein